MVGEVMEKNITGTMFYYYFVCKRKLWYFSQNIEMEQNSSNVEIGKFIDENYFEYKDIFAKTGKVRGR